jgi:outer membrane lipoprotein-sorting protein
VAFGIALLAGAAPALAQQFSADLVADLSRPGGSVAQKIYVSNGRVRIESPGAGVIIVDGPAHTSYMLMPEQKMYVDERRGAELATVFAPADPENPCPEWQRLVRSTKGGPGWSCHRVGTDTVNGRETVKFQAEADDNSNKGFVWIDPKLKFMVKTETADGRSKMELRNIREGAQPPELFVIPADYKKMDLQQLMQQLQRPKP